MNLPEYEYFDIIIKSKDALGNTYNTATPPVITASTPYNLDFNEFYFSLSRLTVSFGFNSFKPIG